jgi:NAD(P)H-dependent FMN reductase
MTGGTLQMAQAATAGARTEPAMRILLVRAQDAHATDVLSAAGFIFASPENLAGMSGQMKDFFDRTYYSALDQVNGRPYGTMICAGSDGRNAAQQIDRIATGWRLKQIADPLIVCTRAQTPEDILRPKVIAESSLKQCEALGATLASGIAMGIF